FESWFSVRLDRINRAFRLANTTIDAFIGVDDEHVLTLVEAVHRTYLDTVRVLTFDTAFIDDVGQLSLLPSSSPGKAISVAEFSASGEGVRRVTGVAASVQPAHIHDVGLGPLSFDLQRGNERVFSMNDNSVRLVFDSESDGELPRH